MTASRQQSKPGSMRACMQALQFLGLTADVVTLLCAVALRVCTFDWQTNAHKRCSTAAAHLVRRVSINSEKQTTFSQAKKE